METRMLRTKHSSCIFSASLRECGALLQQRRPLRIPVPQAQAQDRGRSLGPRRESQGDKGAQEAPGRGRAQLAPKAEGLRAGMAGSGGEKKRQSAGCELARMRCCATANLFYHVF